MLADCRNCKGWDRTRGASHYVCEECGLTPYERVTWPALLKGHTAWVDGLPGPVTKQRIADRISAKTRT